MTAYVNATKAMAAEPSKALNSLRLLGLALLTFCLIYNISPPINESLSTARLAIAFLLVTGIFCGWLKHPLPEIQLLYIFIPVPFVLVQSSLSLDTDQISKFINLFLNSFIGGWLLAGAGRTRENILKAFLLAIFAQSVLLLVSFFNLDLRDFIGQNISVKANFDTVDLYRAPGFTSDAGSSLSVTQSLGVLAGGLLLVMRPDFSKLVTASIVFTIFTIATSCIFVGRTGLIISWLFIFIFLFKRIIPRSSILIAIVVIGAAGAFAVQFIADLLPDFSTDFFLDWAFGFLSGKNESVSELASMPIPPLSIDTIFGTGLVGLINGANPSGHDSGFVQNYYSLGIFLAAILYLAYLNALLRMIAWMPALIGTASALIFFLAEVKEPFLFKYSIMTFLIAAYFARDRQTSRRYRPTR